MAFAVTCVLAACGPGPSGPAATARPSSSAVAAAAKPAALPSAPADYLPRQDQLPPDFVHIPDRDQTVALQTTAGLLRSYRPGARTVSDPALLQIGVTLSDDERGAAAVFAATIAGWIAQGYAFDPLEGLGEESMLGRVRGYAGTDQRSPAVIVYFRLGAVVGVVQWSDPANPPSVDQAVRIARLMEALARANPTPRAAVAPSTFPTQAPSQR